MDCEPMQGAMRITLSGAYSIPPEVLFQEVNGEVVALSMATGNYYGMDQLASRIWYLINEEKTLEDIISTLLDEYDISEAQLREDVAEFIEKLVSLGMLVKKDREDG